MGGLVKLVGSGVGLAKEYQAYRKAAKTTRVREAHSPEDGVRTERGSHETGEEVRNETIAHSQMYSMRDDQKNGELCDPSVQGLTAPPAYAPRGHLPLPVIIPQRRPGSNSRGFVRAYAPMLKDCGINQTLWFNFLNGFHEALKMTPLFHVANAAIALGSIPIPSMIGQVSAMAVGTAVQISSKQYTKYQTNKYLDNMNEEVFKHRGLYVAIMSFEPDSSQAGEVVDVNTNRVTASAGRIGGIHSERFRTSSGTTHGEFELPQAAPLVYPDLNELPENQRTNRMNKTGFLDDYLDRRAQAKFDSQNPGSRLAAPQPTFASSWSDPTAGVHNSSNLRDMVTGTRGSGGDSVRGRGREHRQRPQAEYATSSGEKERSGGLKKLTQQRILYLTVVNLPSEKEFEVAHAMLQQMNVTN